MQMNKDKTFLLTLGKNPSPVHFQDGAAVPKRNAVAYLWSQLSAGGQQAANLASRLGMASEAFEGFYLSNLEYGVRSHHDHLRKILPIYNSETAPKEEDLVSLNNEMANASGV